MCEIKKWTTNLPNLLLLTNIFKKQPQHSINHKSLINYCSIKKKVKRSHIQQQTVPHYTETV